MTNRLKLDEGSVYSKRNTVRTKYTEYESSRMEKKGMLRIICKGEKKRNL